MKIGYARVSTQDQKLELQIDALTEAGCEQMFQEKISGKNELRAELQVCLRTLREGDTLVVYKLDRLARSLRDLLNIANQLSERKINLISIVDKIDTSTPLGRFFFSLSGALAEFERDLIIERTKAGLKSAWARGRKGGRKAKLSDENITLALDMLANPRTTKSQVAAILKVSRATLDRELAKYAKIGRESTEHLERLRLERQLKSIKPADEI